MAYADCFEFRCCVEATCRERMRSVMSGVAVTFCHNLFMSTKQNSVECDKACDNCQSAYIMIMAQRTSFSPTSLACRTSFQWLRAAIQTLRGPRPPSNVFTWAVYPQRMSCLVATGVRDQTGAPHKRDPSSPEAYSPLVSPCPVWVEHLTTRKTVRSDNRDRRLKSESFRRPATFGLHSDRDSRSETNAIPSWRRRCRTLAHTCQRNGGGGTGASKSQTSLPYLPHPRHCVRA